MTTHPRHTYVSKRKRAKRRVVTPLRPMSYAEHQRRFGVHRERERT